MSTDVDVVVIGGGPGGIAAAREAARLGARVTLVSEGPVGGRAGWHSLLPSKGLLAGAGDAPRGAHPDDEKLAAILKRVEKVAAAYNGTLAAELEALSVTVVPGLARFVGEHRIEVTPESGMPLQIDFDRAIIATGSVPFFPAGMNPDGQRIIAPRFVRKLTHLPKTMLVIGGGATGTEMAHAFSALGVAVTWIVDHAGVLPTFDRTLVARLVAAYERRGIRVVSGAPVTHLEHDAHGVRATTASSSIHAAEMAFVAVGRRPDIGRIELGAIGLLPGASGEIEADAEGRTRVSHVFAVGDATGAPLVANKAEVQGVIAARAALDADRAPIDPRAIVEAVYGVPEIARCGAKVDDAPGLVATTVSLARTLAGHLDDLAPHDDEAVVTLVTDTDGHVVGGAALGPSARELASTIALAVRTGATRHDLASTGFATPAYSEALRLAALS